MEFPVEPPFHTSSVAIQQDGLMNVRSVNYTITDKGEYIPHEGIVDTRNYQA